LKFVLIPTHSEQKFVIYINVETYGKLVLFPGITFCPNYHMHLFRSINFGEPFNSALIFGSQFIGHFISDKAKAKGGTEGKVGRE